jgi:hypothetical protein
LVNLNYETRKYLQ